MMSSNKKHQQMCIFLKIVLLGLFPTTTAFSMKMIDVLTDFKEDCDILQITQKYYYNQQKHIEYKELGESNRAKIFLSDNLNGEYSQNVKRTTGKYTY